jgi:hypothetical protein
MNKDYFALPVDRTRLSDYYKQVESFQSERARAARRISSILAAMPA